MTFKKSNVINGFTILEVFVLLGVLILLAAKAIPKFTDFQSKANIDRLKTMGDAILSNANLVYSEAIIQKVEHEPVSSINLDHEGLYDIEIHYGYPSASPSNGLSKLMQAYFSDHWAWSTGIVSNSESSNDNSAYTEEFWLTTTVLSKTKAVLTEAKVLEASACYLRYAPATSTQAFPKITYITTGC